VVHPAARLLVMAAEQQEKEVGDASNFVVVFGGELLHRAEALLRMGLHPSDVIEGYTQASRRALEVLDTLVIESVADPRDHAQLVRAVRTAIASKQYGFEDLLAPIVADACLATMPRNTKNFNVDNVRVVKIMGASIYDTKTVRGMVFGREPESTSAATRRLPMQLHPYMHIPIHAHTYTYRHTHACKHIRLLYRGIPLFLTLYVAVGCSHHQDGDQGQGGGVHVPAGHCAHRDQGHRAHSDGRGAAQL
jgi:hypothetical protein